MNNVVTKIDNNTLKTLIQAFYGVEQVKAKELLEKVDIVKKDMYEIVNGEFGEYDTKEIIRGKYRYYIVNNEYYKGVGSGLYASIDNNRVIWKIC